MPQWRKLHTKIIESEDFNDMLSDFDRLLWVLLTTCAVDSEGRGIDKPSWVKAKTMPLRDDVSPDLIMQAMNWYEHAGMIVRYSTDEGRGYFYVPTFKQYQRTDREAPSSLPAPPDRPTPDLLPTYSTLDKNRVDKNRVEVEESDNTSPTSGTPNLRIQSPDIAEYIYRQVTGSPSMPSRGREGALQIIYDLQHVHGNEIVDYLVPFYTAYINTKGQNGMTYYKGGYGWLDWAAVGEIPAKQEKDTEHMTQDEYVKRILEKDKSNAGNSVSP